MRSNDLGIIALVVIVVALAIGSVRMDSATSDEPAHIANGVIKVSERWLNFFREQPPLMNSLSGVPLVLAGYRMPPGWKGENHWVAGRRFLYYSGHDAYRILFLARLPTIALFGALCLVMYWFVLQQTSSRAWALAAAALTGFCPNLMAHGRLATVDLALTFFAFTATVLLFRVLDRPSLLNAILLGVMTVAAPMSKISGVILAPYFVLVIALAFVLRRVKEPRRFLRALAIAAIAGLVFFEGFMLAETSGEYAHTQYPEMARVLVPFAEFAAEVQTIRAWYAQGNALPQFLLGEFSWKGWPHYYFVALLLKTTIPAILLAIVALVIGFRKREFHFLALLLFVVLFLIVAASGQLALGIRYVLPIYPFVYAMIILSLNQWRTGAPPVGTGEGARPPQNLRGARASVAVLTLLLLWHVSENLIAWPHYLGYFNELIGSKRNADKLLIDSNLDWGQDLRRLDVWCRANGVNAITVHYFGGGDVAYEIRSAKPAIRFAPGPGLLPKGYFALSKHFYRLSFFEELWGIDYDTYLGASHARYVTTVGESIDVYRVE